MMAVHGSGMDGYHSGWFVRVPAMVFALGSNWIRLGRSRT
jgi:hypothetical protein